MQHFQQKIACGKCKRSFIVDIVSVGSTHQWVHAVTCEECAEVAGGVILAEGEVREVQIPKVPEGEMIPIPIPTAAKA